MSLVRSSWPDISIVKGSIGLIDGIVLPDNPLIDDLLQNYLDGAIDSFNGDTGWEPFLADSSATEAIYDPPDGMEGRFVLNLINGVQTSTLSIYIGYSPTNAGTLLVLNTDFYVRSRNQIEFITNPGSSPQSIRILTPWGYDVEVPIRAYNAVIAKTIFEFLGNTGSSIANAIEVKQDTVDIKFNPSKSVKDNFENIYNDAVAFYQRNF